MSNEQDNSQAKEDAAWLAAAEKARKDGYAPQERVDAFLKDFAEDKKSAL